MRLVHQARSTTTSPSTLWATRLLGVITAASLLACDTGAGTTPVDPSGTPTAEATDADDAVIPQDDVVERVDRRCTFTADDSMSIDYWEPGPFEIDTIDITFFDASRPIIETDSHAAADGRQLVTTIYYPAEPGFAIGEKDVAEDGPFPMLMYSHGFSSSKDEAKALSEQLASYGYIVVAPSFPLSNMMANNMSPDVTDVVNQPGDVSFLIDQMLAKNMLASDHFHGAIDPERIGAVGLSLGGLTTYLVGYHADFHDPRLTAIMPIAGPAFLFTERYFDTRDLPLLIVHGDIDSFIDYESNARAAFDRASPSAQLLTIAQGSHAGFGMPVDAWMTDLVATFIAPDDAHPDNPDGLGCGAVAEGLQASDPDFMTGLGGEEQGIEMAEEDAAAQMPCTGDEYTREALAVDEQMEILVASAAAFFESTFAASAPVRAGACRFLNESVPEHPAAVIE